MFMLNYFDSRFSDFVVIQSNIGRGETKRDHRLQRYRSTTAEYHVVQTIRWVDEK